MQRIPLFMIGCLLGLAAGAQRLNVYPSNWWVGMKHATIQVMLHGGNVGETKRVSVDYPGVTVVDWHRVSNAHYLFVHLRIDPSARPGTVRIALAGVQPATASLPLSARRDGNGTAYAQGVGPADFIYFLMPDRWSNGDPGNDRVPGLRDQSLNRDSMYLRHGGDLQGIVDHLDYLQSLGVTTLWMTPVILNDMPNRTEHGYAFTEHYTIEPRPGGAAMYKQLADSLHRRGMKLIQDAVYNHVGLYHFFIQDLPEKNWLNQWPKYTQTDYRDEPLFDPHASDIDKKITSDGWFNRQMPDLNQD